MPLACDDYNSHREALRSAGHCHHWHLSVIRNFLWCECIFPVNNVIVPQFHILWQAPLVNQSATMASMISAIRRSLSGDKQPSPDIDGESEGERKSGKGKRFLSGDQLSGADAQGVMTSNKRSRLQKSTPARELEDGELSDFTDLSDDETSEAGSTEVKQHDSSPPSTPSAGSSSTLPPKQLSLPEGTPDWGVKMVEILQAEIRSINMRVGAVDVNSQKNSASIKQLEDKVVKMEKENVALKVENSSLCERVLDLEY